MKTRQRAACAGPSTAPMPSLSFAQVSEDIITRFTEFLENLERRCVILPDPIRVLGDFRTGSVVATAGATGIPTASVIPRSDPGHGPAIGRLARGTERQ